MCKVTHDMYVIMNADLINHLEHNGYEFCPQTICVFRTILVINSYYFSKQY
jgi:hypothetical protein